MYNIGEEKMNQYVIYIICLLVLNVGLVGVFFAKDIVERLKVKNKGKVIRVARLLGVVVAIVALCVIYFLSFKYSLN